MISFMTDMLIGTMITGVTEHFYYSILTSEDNCSKIVMSITNMYF